MLRSMVAKPESGPLDGVSVVVCRAADDAGSLLARLRDLGAEPILVPLHRRVGPGDGGAALLAAVADLESYEWLVATSANGVRSVLDAMEARSWPEQIRVAAVGPATARAFAEAGIEVHLVASPSTAVELGRAFPMPAVASDTAPADAAVPPRVLAPLAEAADDALTEALSAKGYRVDRVDAYRMAEPPPEAGQHEAVARADALLLTAPSIVDRFIDRFSLDGVPPLVVSIGPRTTARSRGKGIDQLVAAGSHRLVVADSHDEDGLIETLLATLQPVGLDGVSSPIPRWTGADDAASSKAVERPPITEGKG